MSAVRGNNHAGLPTLFPRTILYAVPLLHLFHYPPMLDPQEKVLPRPYKCPYALCGRAFSRLEHQVSSLCTALATFSTLPRLGTFELTPAKNPLSAPILLAENVFLAQMNSLATPAFTTTTFALPTTLKNLKRMAQTL